MGPCLPDWPLVLVEILARGLLNGCRGVLLCYQINFLVKNSVMGDVCVCRGGIIRGQNNHDHLFLYIVSTSPSQVYPQRSLI